MADPAGEADSGTLRLDFDRRVMLRFHGSAITSDGGLLAYRELDDVLALTTSGGERLAEARTGRNRRHLLVGLLRQSVFGRLAGYEDVNDADRLCRDPAMRWVIGGKAPMDRAASASQMGRFETEWLARPENLAALADLPGQWIDAVHQRRPPRTIVLDMDSSESPTYGEQEGSAYNGHFGCTCYHPLFVFNQLGDLERCALRPGNVHSADGWRDVLEPVVSRYRGRVKRLYFRGDAAFAMPEVYEFLEAQGMGYAIRLPANRVLQDKIGHLLKRPVGRPPQEVRRYYSSFSYRAGSWNKPRRMVAKVEWHAGELYPRVGFTVTNLARPAERVVAFYNHRGTCEQYIKEGRARSSGRAYRAAPSTAEVCPNEGKATSLALRGGRPDDWAANRGGCDRISLRRTSMRPKILPNSPEIRGMSADTCAVLAESAAQCATPDPRSIDSSKSARFLLIPGSRGWQPRICEYRSLSEDPVGVAIMLKRIIVASALALFSSGPAGAAGAAMPPPSLPARQLPGVSTTPGLFDAVQACEAQMRRMAGLNKTLTAKYNAKRVHDECVTSTRAAVRGTRIMQKRFPISTAASPKGHGFPSKDPEAGLLKRSVLVIIPMSPPQLSSCHD